MKKLLYGFLVAAFVFVANAAYAQTVVVQGNKLEWDHPGMPMGTVTYRVYTELTPGIVPDGTSFIAEVADPTKEWPIQGLTVGSQYFSVVSAYHDDGVGNTVESGPSNEIDFLVFGPPTNYRIAMYNLGFGAEEIDNYLKGYGKGALVTYTGD